MLGATAAVTVAIVVASFVVYFLVQNELRGQIDRDLRSESARINKVPRYLASLAYEPNVYSLHVPAPTFSGYFQLVGRDGRVYIPETFVTKTPRLPVTDRVKAVAAGKEEAYFFDTQIQGEDTRVLTIPSSNYVPAVAIQVVAQLSSVDHELAVIRRWLAVAAFGGITIAAGTAFLIARTTLRPVQNLSETAERVRATRDLSERIEVEGSEELRRLASTFNAMLESLDDAAQRQKQLVQDASHELRTPLTSLRTNIEVLAKGDLLGETDRAQLLQDVIGQIGEMTAVVSELTELARGEEQAAQLEEVRLDLVTEDAVRRIQRNHPDIPIQADLEPTTLTGVPAGLERAIGNLLDNAAKWSAPGAVVEVTLAGRELTVRDHGPGIAPEDAPHVFERFYRATSARSMPGSGLGLSIVQKVAEAHGGSVSAEQAPGGGTLMRLRLPQRGDETPEE